VTSHQGKVKLTQKNANLLQKMSKRDLEERRRKEIEEENAKVFEDFVETFQNSSNSAASKVWVKAGTYDAGTRREDTKEKGKLYKPTPRAGASASTSDERLTSTSSAQEYARMLASSDSRKDLSHLGKKKSQEKKKSNLELFKEELKQMQEEREERHKYKHAAKTMMQMQIHSVLEHPEPIYREVQEPQGSFDTGDPNTTNLYLGNLNPKITEQQLMEIFGVYGPLASVKIMWPRSDEEKARGRNCGFVAFMARKDAERALRRLAGKDVMGYEMKLGWGKAVPIMTHPIYIPPKLQQFAMPPIKSGLPFNAQPLGDVTNVNIDELDLKSYLTDDEMKKRIDEVLSKSIVKVVIPTERPLLMLIHRMIEFVVREGPVFESIIMTREKTNPSYRFLFDFHSAAHIYYRWKLFSLLQGDSPTEWNEKEFRMYKGSSIWQPPKLNFFSQGMPEELISDEELMEPCKGQLSVAQRNRLEDLIRHLTPERSKIADAMVFCIEHADAADEICDCIAESLTNPQTTIHKKIARIYLVSDILHNCTVKVQNASFFRKS
jgi:U2-associated protein SR140